MTDKIDGRKNNRPPADHQFKRGQSRNPLGRPKKRPREFSGDQLLRDVLHISSMKVKVDLGRGKKEVTIQEALIIRMLTKAANGDNGMIKAAIPLLMEAYGQNRSENRAAFDGINQIMDYLKNFPQLRSQPAVNAKLDSLRELTKPL